MKIITINILLLSLAIFNNKNSQVFFYFIRLYRKSGKNSFQSY